ncbi:Outer membrane protein assembly factor BamB, contains PQQ-like beta-propeller repeat [Halorientalis regularis]|uniref:Outer membrane protein assembly factor BamB, contains PQQ-like beta-propeller repeat n=2 Tax=Halorientalis regularis TaxID=660518 RepID=A0A1G7LXW4_9EURY|nr:Outer membrane protein assembly factor BamB, contains PQQ-like beta-propeller repeat [Halorientalis regularis]
MLLTGLGVTGSGDAIGVASGREKVISRQQISTDTDQTAEAAQSTQSGSTWPQFQYGPGNGGSPSASGQAGTQQWRFGTGNVWYSSPAVVDGTVYVGSDDNNVYALSADDGTEQWRFDTGSPVEQSPAVVDGTVYLGSYDRNVAPENDGNMYALSADDGTEQWRFETGGWMMSPPAVVDGTVYFGSYDRNVYALAAADGSEQWRFEARYAVRSSPAVVDGTVYIGDSSNVYALSADDGTEQWRFEAGKPGESSPAVVDGTVYIAGIDNMYALSADDGTEQWRFEAGNFGGSSPAVVNGTVYILSKGNVSSVYALSADDGTELWRFEGSYTVDSSPAVVDGTVYIGGKDDVYALSADDGTEQWRFDTGSTVMSPPVVVDGTVYIGGYNDVYALPQDGPTVIFKLMGRASQNAPLIAGGGAAIGATALAGLGIRRYRRGSDEPTDPIRTDSGVNAWPTSGHDPGRTAAVATKPAPVSSPETAFQYQPADGAVATSPVVADDLLFLGTTDDEIHAVSLASRDTEWTTALDGEDTTSLAVTTDAVVVATDDGVETYRASDGEHRWSDSPGAVRDIIAADAIYTGTDYGIRAYEAAGGSQKWRTSLDGSVSAIAVGEETVYAATARDAAALDTKTGNQQWTCGTNGRNPTLTVAKDGIVVSTRAGVRVYDPETGEQVWANDEGGHSTAIALAHRRVYQTTDTAVRALEGRTGTEIWRTAIDATTGPLVIGDTVYVGTEDDLVALDAEDGEYRFTHDLPGVLGELAVVGNAILCQTGDGTLTIVTGNLDEAPELHATIQAMADEADETADENAGATGTDQETVPDSMAGRFARDCDAIEVDDSVSTRGPVHVYDGQYVDQQGETDARIYALAPEYEAEETAVDAFETAAREWQGISKNTHVTTVYDTGGEPRPWVAFDAGEGRLDDHLESLDRHECIDTIVDITEAARTGSMYNVVHGDVCLETVFFGSDQAGERVATLADWGLQRGVESYSNDAIVTPYTAPEQLDGRSSSAATDIYQVGALAYRLLTGEPPFADAADLEATIVNGDLTLPTTVDPSLPAEINEILNEAMAVDPDDRPQPYDFHQRLVATMDD